jgi:hypothetical protein
MRPKYQINHTNYYSMHFSLYRTVLYEARSFVTDLRNFLHRLLYAEGTILCGRKETCV